MFHACRGAVRLCRSFFAIASGLVLASCSSAGGSGTGEPADTSNSAAPVLRTANGQQIFGAGSADSSAGSMVAASPVGATPAESRETPKNPVLASPDAGAASSPPSTPRPPPSAAPLPSDTPSAPSDDDDDDDDDDDAEEDD